jgi:hypothetical protein
LPTSSGKGAEEKQVIQVLNYTKRIEDAEIIILYVAEDAEGEEVEARCEEGAIVTTPTPNFNHTLRQNLEHLACRLRRNHLDHQRAAPISKVGARRISALERQGSRRTIGYV